jgi:protein SCO1
VPRSIEPNDTSRAAIDPSAGQSQSGETLATAPAATPWRLRLALALTAIGVIGLWLALVFSPIGNDMRDQIAQWFEGAPVLGGPFALKDQAGNPVSDETLRGKPFALFFGFTNCPDICPTTLSDIGTWLTGLGPDADKIRFAMVTVDPERDTVPVLKTYMSAFDPRILGLTGSQANIDQIVQNYRVYARKVDQGGGSYSMDHSAAVYLMDARGRYWSVVSRGETEAGAVAKIKKLIHGG